MIRIYRLLTIFLNNALVFFVEHFCGWTYFDELVLVCFRYILVVSSPSFGLPLTWSHVAGVLIGDKHGVDTRRGRRRIHHVAGLGARGSPRQPGAGRVAKRKSAAKGKGMERGIDHVAIISPATVSAGPSPSALAATGHSFRNVWSFRCCFDARYQ